MKFKELLMLLYCFICVNSQRQVGTRDHILSTNIFNVNPPLCVQLLQQVVIFGKDTTSLFFVFNYYPVKKTTVPVDNLGEWNTMHVNVFLNLNRTNETMVLSMEIKDRMTLCVLSTSDLERTKESIVSSGYMKKAMFTFTTTISLIRIPLLTALVLGFTTAIVTRKRYMLNVFKSVAIVLIIDAFIREILPTLILILETQWSDLSAVTCAFIGLYFLITVYIIILVCKLEVDSEQLVVTHWNPCKNLENSGTFTLLTLHDSTTSYTL